MLFYEKPSFKINVVSKISPKYFLWSRFNKSTSFTKMCAVSIAIEGIENEKKKHLFPNEARKVCITSMLRGITSTRTTL